MSETATEADGGYVCGDCGEELDDIVMVVEHDCSPVPISAPSLSRKERNTLLYIESRVVDHAGKLDMKQMNHTDQQNIKLFTAAGLLEVAQPEEFTHNPREDYEQVSKFTDDAWDIVRDCRQIRALDDDRVDFPVGDRPKAPETLPVEGVFCECFQCGTDIRYGEWHIAVDTDTDMVPKDTPAKVQCGGESDEKRRLCGPCSGRTDENFPNGEPIAGE